MATPKSRELQQAQLEEKTTIALEFKLDPGTLKLNSLVNKKLFFWQMRANSKRLRSEHLH